MMRPMDKIGTYEVMVSLQVRNDSTHTGINGIYQMNNNCKRGMIQFIGLFDKQMKEFVEMLYLTEKPVVLSGEKYEKCIGELPKLLIMMG